MAVSGITNSNSVLIPDPAATRATRGVDPIRQNVQPINPQNAGVTTSTPAATPLADAPILTPATQAVDAIQENELLVSAILRNLVFPDGDPLFDVPPLTQLDEIPSAIAIEEERVSVIPGEAAVAPATINFTLANEEPVVVPFAAATAMPVTATPRAGGEMEVTLPVKGIFLNQGLPPFSPANLPIVRFPDRIPYVQVVYQINDPAPLPSRLAEPIAVDVQPAAAVAEIRAVGSSRFRQALLWARSSEQTENVEYNETSATVVQVERSIRHSLDQVNSDMAAYDRPLHLVFAKQENRLALDVYDCSYSDACWVTYKSPISLDNLTGVLDNLERKTGIIVNTQL